MLQGTEVAGVGYLEVLGMGRVRARDNRGGPTPGFNTKDRAAVASARLPLGMR